MTNRTLKDAQVSWLHAHLGNVFTRADLIRELEKYPVDGKRVRFTKLDDTVRRTIIESLSRGTSL